MNILNTTVRKIGLILLFVILLPALIFSIYQITTLNQSEKILEEIYNNQLDALLFSINQYSEDAASRFQMRLNNIYQIENSKLFDQQLDSLLSLYPYIKKIYFTDSSLHSSDQNFEKVLKLNEDIIYKLYYYKKEKYNRIEPIQDQDNLYLLFVTNNSYKNNLCGILLDDNKFIEDVLTPKILSVAKNEFFIYLFSEKKVFRFNSEEDINPKYLKQQIALWLLPAYKIAIKLKGSTIEDLVRARTRNNLIMILGLIIILIAGGWFVFRNIKNEVELAQIKSEFVSNVSHELRTPLALISMFAETLEMERVKSDDKKREYYSIISSETARLSSIVNKILSFSKMEAGKRHFNFKEVDLNTIIEHVLESYKFHLQNNGFKYFFQKYNGSLKIKADSEAVSEAVINLLDNAVKYSSNKKNINVITGADNNYIFVEISDEGIGIAKEEQKKVFEKFYRVKSGLVHDTKGTGLGLSIVKQIMDAHKGEVAIDSELGKGSSFKLKFKRHS